MLNRTQSPPFKAISAINFIKPVKQLLDNEVPVYILNGAKQELIRLEFIIDNIDFDPANPIRTMAVSSLLKNGTKTKTAKEIAEAIDHYGAFLDAEYGPDTTTVTLYSLNKHLEAVLPVLQDVMVNSTFPQRELDIYKRNNKQKFQVNMQKNDFIARKKFSHALYGHTPYGSEITMESYDKVTQQEIADYYAATFLPGNYTIVASGNFNEAEFQLVNKFFGSDSRKVSIAKKNNYNFPATQGAQLLIERKDAIQSALRIGVKSINRTHADFPGLSVLTTIFGGYFGSRLMTNIREDKGYTYGIGAALMSLRHSGQFFIATEVGTDVAASALEEIYKEINLLKTELVSEDELSLVRNYMLGSLLGSLENIFSHADKFKNLYLAGLDYGYYDRYISTVRNITAEELRNLANKYFKTEDFIELVVGKK